METVEAGDPEEAERKAIARAGRIARMWLAIARSGELTAECWIPEHRVLVHVRSRWTRWGIAVELIEALLRPGTRRPLDLVFIGPESDVYHAPAIRRLRFFAMRRGLRTLSARTCNAQT